ncbi:MAG TPA: hypothetical protein VG347_02065 [Verrucomicrobiae bacterium]|nr:hypothetical protein [Verrucomicrobiae bacterium]
MQNIDFQILVEQHFSFLVSSKGYRCVDAKRNCVRFESATVFIEVVFDDFSYELGLLVGVIKSKDHPFSIGEILRSHDAPEAELFSLVQVTTIESMNIWLKKIAEALVKYGNDFIAGNMASFMMAMEQRKQDVQIYSVERALRIARVEVEAAWRVKDYATIVKFFKPLLSKLTLSEVAKLEYAEKQKKNS